MAGRGRGRGARGMSFTPEQLGLTKAEQVQLLTTTVLQPPMKYPPLEFKASPFVFTAELSYLVQLKRDLSEYFRESPSNVQKICVKKDIERYSDKYRDDVTCKLTYEQSYDWSRLPLELRPLKRKVKEAKRSVNKNKQINIEQKLEKLEMDEATQQSDDETEEKPKEDQDKDEDEELVEDEEHEADEEMDVGTDYMNSYFDGGEGYEDEDDNLDDGPTY